MDDLVDNLIEVDKGEEIRQPIEGTEVPSATQDGSGAPVIQGEYLPFISRAQERFRLLADMGVKGVILHLAITAYSLTFAFENLTDYRAYIVAANVLVTLLALAATIAITRDLEATRERIRELHRESHVRLGSTEFQGLIATGKMYGVWCVAIVVVWVVIGFVGG